MAVSRRTVTVLFADVADSTPLGERLDPESLRQVMPRWFEGMSEVLERHGGTVEKFIGDAVMAVFGIPDLHEDDALRAVRAATELREAMTRLNDELGQELEVHIGIRVGLNTGEVVAGDGTGGQKRGSGGPGHVANRVEGGARTRGGATAARRRGLSAGAVCPTATGSPFGRWCRSSAHSVRRRACGRFSPVSTTGTWSPSGC